MSSRTTSYPSSSLSWKSLILPISLSVLIAGCARFPHATVYWGGFKVASQEVTKASYVDPMVRGQIGAFGEPHDPDAMTAGHPELAYGTFIRVTNLDNGRAAILRVNDRGSDTNGNRLYVTYKASQLLEIPRDGGANVRVEEVEGQVGVASWYGSAFHGRPTSNGEIYDQFALTGAHRFLPFGTIVKVTNLETHQEVVVRINDRGGFIKGRIIDLSRRAAEDIGMTGNGVGLVALEIIPPPAPNGSDS